MNTVTLRARTGTYPEGMALLRLMDDRPKWRAPPLYLRGALPRAPGIAVVGTRHATERAIAFAAELVAVIAELGCSVWSGGALGVDAIAHKTALAKGTRTVVVTAGGLDDPYPPQHQALYRQVLADGGALLSLQADGVERRRHQFLDRNRVLAALTIATLVVQAPVRSGARSTAHAARKLGKPLFVVPAEPWSTRGGGCAHELGLGARAASSPRQLKVALLPLLQCYQAGHSLLAPMLLHAPSDRAGGLGWHLGARASHPGSADDAPAQAAAAYAAGSAVTATREAAATPPAPPAGSDEAQVLAALGAEAVHTDAICTTTDLPPHRVSGALMRLRIGGLAVEAALGLFCRAP